jgi:peptide-methionine (S)-S-oxide reductase
MIDPVHPPSGRRETATLAGGCFWCLEAVYNRLQGVEQAVSGYVGGHTEHPSYQEVCSGRTGHAEVVQITYDPIQVSYRDLLEIFFAIHDPTTPNRQGNDVGTQYRSAVFWHTPEQKRTAEELIAELAAEDAFADPIATEIQPAGTFWPAEDYHQRYYDLNPQQPYCRFVVGPKLAKFRAKFATRLRPGG